MKNKMMIKTFIVCCISFLALWRVSHASSQGSGTVFFILVLFKVEPSRLLRVFGNRKLYWVFALIWGVWIDSHFAFSHIFCLVSSVFGRPWRLKPGFGLIVFRFLNIAFTFRVRGTIATISVVVVDFDFLSKSAPLDIFGIVVFFNRSFGLRLFLRMWAIWILLIIISVSSFAKLGKLRIFVCSLFDKLLFLELFAFNFLLELLNIGQPFFICLGVHLPDNSEHGVNKYDQVLKEEGFEVIGILQEAFDVVVKADCELLGVVGLCDYSLTVHIVGIEERVFELLGLGIWCVEVRVIEI